MIAGWAVADLLTGFRRTWQDVHATALRVTAGHGKRIVAKFKLSGTTTS